MTHAPGEPVTPGKNAGPPALPGPGDALILVDVQKDFLPGGALAVPRGDEVLAPLHRAIEVFQAHGLPTFATRDWHPADHCSFKAQGGPWPPHCVAGSPGAELAPELELPQEAHVISKATTPQDESYSGFDGTDLLERLRSRGVSRVFVGGLATDYCVLNTVKDALRSGLRTFLLTDAVRAIDAEPGDGQKALDEMVKLGAVLVAP